jgi:hypothetical protein
MSLVEEGESCLPIYTEENLLAPLSHVEEREWSRSSKKWVDPTVLHTLNKDPTRGNDPDGDNEPCGSTDPAGDYEPTGNIESARDYDPPRDLKIPSLYTVHFQKQPSLCNSPSTDQGPLTSLAGSHQNGDEALIVPSPLILPPTPPPSQNTHLTPDRFQYFPLHFFCSLK